MTIKAMLLKFIVVEDNIIIGEIIDKSSIVELSNKIIPIKIPIIKLIIATQ